MMISDTEQVVIAAHAMMWMYDIMKGLYGKSSHKISVEGKSSYLHNNNKVVG